MSAQHKTVAANEPQGTPEFHSHTGLYLGVGGALIGLTVITVALAYVDFGHDHLNILIGMLVAAAKASLVAAVFMHLKGEKKTILQFLIFTAFFCIALFLLTLLAYKDHVFF